MSCLVNKKWKTREDAMAEYAMNQAFIVD